MKKILNRLYQLLLKCLSFKFFVGIVLPTFLLWKGKIDATAWWIAAGATIFAHSYDKKLNPLPPKDGAPK